MARKTDNAEPKPPRAKREKAAPPSPAAGTTAAAGPAEGTAGSGHRNEQIGTVVKAKMQKTVVVAVERLVQHDVYRKTIRRTSTFMAHDEKGAKQGDRVRIVETRPLSKRKRWRVEEILVRGAGVEDTASEIKA
jgi:small subunit ribosomal protein S17